MKTHDEPVPAWVYKDPEDLSREELIRKHYLLEKILDCAKEHFVNELQKLQRKANAKKTPVQK